MLMCSVKVMIKPSRSTMFKRMSPEHYPFMRISYGRLTHCSGAFSALRKTGQKGCIYIVESDTEARCAPACPLCCDPWQLGAFILIGKNLIGASRERLPSPCSVNNPRGVKVRKGGRCTGCRPLFLRLLKRAGTSQGSVVVYDWTLSSAGYSASPPAFSSLARWARGSVVWKTPRGRAWPPLHPLGTDWPFWMERLTWTPHG